MKNPPYLNCNNLKLMILYFITKIYKRETLFNIIGSRVIKKNRSFSLPLQLVREKKVT